MRVVLIALSVLAVSCAAGAPEAPPTSAAEATARDTCGASGFSSLVGAPTSAIDERALPQGTRIVTPETMITQDFRPDRLNIIVNSDGVVASLSCF